MSDIVKWETIQDQFCDGLLLGNGASKAVHSNFDYHSLFDAATSLKYITPPVEEIFKQFGTKDFELVLRYLWRAKLVNKALDIISEQVDDAYQEIQNALISTIRETHSTYEQVEPHLTSIYQFMSRFKTVVSLNYDLIIYWATQQSRKKIGGWFKDCFVNGNFADDIKALKRPCNADGATLFFYPHGNLVLIRTKDGKEEKVTVSGCANLLDAIFERWKDDNNIVPLFVCEGSYEYKKRAIENASYLSRVYHEIMPSLNESLVIYGWSMSKQDQHIMTQLNREKNLQRVAVSVHENDFEYVVYAKKQLEKQKIKEIIFFDAASPGSWNNSFEGEL